MSTTPSSFGLSSVGAPKLYDIAWKHKGRIDLAAILKDICCPVCKAHVKSAWLTEDTEYNAYPLVGVEVLCLCEGVYLKWCPSMFPRSRASLDIVVPATIQSIAAYFKEHDWQYVIDECARVKKETPK